LLRCTRTKKIARVRVYTVCKRDVEGDEQRRDRRSHHCHDHEQKSAPDSEPGH
jgi:hypothetical protein